MNTEDLAYMLRSHGICEILDDLNNTGLPDIMLFSGGHAIFIFVGLDENQLNYIKRISNQLAPHFIWTYQGERLDNETGTFEIATHEHAVAWLDHIEEENKDFDYLAKYSEES